MRVNNNGIPPWHRDYVQSSQPVSRNSQTEGVRFERSVRQAQKTPDETPQPDKTRKTQKTEPQGNVSDLLTLLSSEEKQTLAKLFPDRGPDWGVAAYRRSVASPKTEAENPSGHVDLLG